MQSKLNASGGSESKVCVFLLEVSEEKQQKKAEDSDSAETVTWDKPAVVKQQLGGRVRPIIYLIRRTKLEQIIFPPQIMHCKYVDLYVGAERYSAFILLLDVLFF